MTMGKPHLIGSLVMMVAAIAYSVWSFQSPAGTTAAGPGTVPPVADMVPGGGGAPGAGGAPAGVDPASIPLVPDVVLDRLPQFPRNPFLAPRAPVADVPAADVAAPVPDAPAEPELVVNGIMYAPPRLSAVINDRRVGVGDRIGAETVVDILPDAVVVESALRGRRTIERRRLGSRAPAARTGAVP
jgi:hypothetical protein